MEQLVNAETQFIPALSVSGTYDSNVFYTPKSLLSPNLKPEDYYVTIAPQLIAARRGESINGSLTVGAIVTRYQNNPDLDYTGINAAGIIDMTQWVSKFSPRIESLSVTGSYQFTPNISAFGVSGVGSSGGGFGSAGLTGPLDAGLITNRVSMNNYTGVISGGYRLTPVTNMVGSYSYTQMSFGNQSGGVNNALFDTIGHQGMAGITTLLSAKDSVGTTATLAHYSQAGDPSGSSAGGQTGSFTTISSMATWSRQWTRELNLSIGGGGILTLPIESGIPGEKIKSTVTPAITTILTYSSFSESLRTAGTSLSSLGPFEGLPSLAGSLRPGGVLAVGRYSATLSYNLSIFPSYAIGAGPMKAHVVGANASAGITSNLTGQVGANYAHGSLSNPGLSFDSLGLTAGLSYLIGSSLIASLTYNYLYFTSSLEQSALVVSEESAFSKKMVTLSLAYAFNGQSFFRPGSFGRIGGASSPGGSSGPSPDPMKPN